MPVGLGKVENVLGFVPPVINNELGWGGSGGGDESGEFHLFSFFGDLNLNLKNWTWGPCSYTTSETGQSRIIETTLAE